MFLGKMSILKTKILYFMMCYNIFMNTFQTINNIMIQYYIDANTEDSKPIYYIKIFVIEKILLCIQLKLI